jgi:putative methionine-R-sulfoxide reductase with GAF domain
VNGPVFASFDGITGGMILDLSEQGLSMQTIVPLDEERRTDRRVQLRLDLPDPETHLETTGYVAWADALGRAGVRFSELPAEARQRLDDWLAHNEQAPSRKAPKLTLDRVFGPTASGTFSNEGTHRPQSVSLEAESGVAEAYGQAARSSTIQYEFHSLGPDLNTALRVISERARTLLRGTGAAIALMDHGPMMCRASVGSGGPPLGTRVDASSGFSGECIRTGKALRCDDTENDSRVEAPVCQKLGIRSMVAAPIRYEREVIGLVEVFSSQTFAFDEGDITVLEGLARTTLLLISQSQLLRQS